jgi:hypothetical protein
MRRHLIVALGLDLLLMKSIFLTTELKTSASDVIYALRAYDEIRKATISGACGQIQEEWPPQGSSGARWQCDSEEALKAWLAGIMKWVWEVEKMLEQRRAVFEKYKLGSSDGFEVIS